MSAPLLSCVTSEGGLLPPELLHRIVTQDRGLPGLTAADYHLDVRLGPHQERHGDPLKAAHDPVGDIREREHPRRRYEQRSKRAHP